MRHIILSFSTPIMLAGLLLLPRALAPDDEGAQVSIVEPAFRPPQEWAYTPDDLTVSAGTTLTWTNTGAVAHTVTADDGQSFDSGSLDPQATFSFTPDAPGAFAYHCAFHPWMTGTVTVTP